MKHGPHPLKLLSLLTACALVYSGNAEAEGQSQAQAPTLKINGFTSFAGYGASQQRKDNGKGGTDPQVNIGASDLYFTVTGKASNGMEYKYRINFETIPGSDAYVNKNYVELNGDLVQHNLVKSVDRKMRCQKVVQTLLAALTVSTVL